MCVAIMDRYLQAQPVSPKKLQLVGIMALLLASKYEECFLQTSKTLFTSPTMLTPVLKFEKCKL